MRSSAIVGILLIAIGAYVLLQGGSVKTRDDLVEIGDVKITTEKSHAIPPWAGGVAIVIGGILVFSGMKKAV